MKKLIAGIVIGGLLFGVVPAFASQVQSLIGQKVTGEYTVTVNGKTLEDKGVVVNGRTNAPVRAISDALGAELKMDGKTIVITTNNEETPSTSDLNIDSNDDIEILKQEREKVAKEITKHEYAINNYVEKYIPSTERAIKMSATEWAKQGYTDQLEKEKSELETFKTELADLQKQLEEIDGKINELDK